MQVTERIEVRKIYLGSAAKFGLLYGLIVGILAAIIILIAGFLGYSADYAFLSFLPLEGVSMLALSALVLCIVAGLITMVVAALIYGLVAKIGGKLHVGLAEYEPEVKQVKPVKSALAKPSQRIAASPKIAVPSKIVKRKIR